MTHPCECCIVFDLCSFGSIPRLRTPSFKLIVMLMICNGGSALALLVELGNGGTIDGESVGMCVSTAAFLHFFDVAGFCWCVRVLDVFILCVSCVCMREFVSVCTVRLRVSGFDVGCLQDPVCVSARVCGAGVGF
ncbi:MAG: hypothetical protein P4L40_22665 [Terracidiphilus sp.]|nr:hypothetical protein [Terracidiphilus sp.]